MKCYPCLEGDVISLSDNSGSAHGTFTSTYGTVTISDIDNLSNQRAAELIMTARAPWFE